MTPALFLDRDGVVNHDIGFVHRPEDCIFVTGVFELVRRARAAGMAVFIVTNQSGIGRGLYDEAQFTQFTDWMLAQFARAGAPITKVYHCPHHPSEALPGYRVVCECRKPEPGMFLAAARAFAIDMGRSTMIGDSGRDLVAAERAGIGRRILYTGAGASGGEPAGGEGALVTASLDTIQFDPA